MYGCGPTVYNYAHIGNQRAYVFYDLLRRYLKYKGYDVKFAMNITDVDDKTIRSSREAGQSLRDYTTFYMNEFFKDWEVLNISRPDMIIRATDEIDAMVDTIEILMQKGHAYKAASGDIFFKIASFPDYGKMANIDASKLKANADGRLADEYEKEDAQDFALWKAWTPADGDVFWDTRIGKGRPGWHIECSTMSHKYLGQPFDIHTGGIDLIFPHHTNEIAQSESYLQHHWCNYWMHVYHLNTPEGKMSKSTGEFLTISLLKDKGYDPISYRFFCLQSHYRKALLFTWKNLDNAAQTYSKLVNRIALIQNDGKLDEQAYAKFAENFHSALDNDLNTSSAITCLYDVLKADINGATKIALIDNFDTVLGLKLIEKSEDIKAKSKSLKAKISTSDFEIVSEEGEENPEVEKLLLERQAAKKEKNFARADEIRNHLSEIGIEVTDVPKGVHWCRK